MLRSMPSELDVVASRTFELRQEGGTSSRVVARIGRPQRDGTDCRRDYEIEGLSKKRRFYAAGVDEMQALWLALVAVGIDLRTSYEGRAGASPSSAIQTSSCPARTSSANQSGTPSASTARRRY